jgi:tryptophan-rich sensory protein
MQDTLVTFVISFAAVALVAGAGTYLTDIGPWYFGLNKPSWKPPDAWFGVIWTTIFGLLAIGLALAWLRADADLRVWIIAAFLANGLLNVGWNLLFFTMRRPDLAMIELVAFWLSIAALIIVCWLASRTAGLLLVPYIVWVTAAGVLNWDILRLNPSFSG